jgi:enoyl-CoA hydratase
MDKSYFLFKVNSEGVAIFTINRPEAYNALNADCWMGIRDCVDKVNTDESIRMLIITGAGEKAFIAGADINFLKNRTMISALDGFAQDILRALENCIKPTIALVNGLALGGGCEVAMACDIRIASEKARFGLPELGLGILPAAGGTQRLAKLVGLGRAGDFLSPWGGLE